MSQRQKQGTMKFVKKSGGLLGKPSSTESSVQGLSKPSDNAQPISDQFVASNPTVHSGYKLRSLDKQLADTVVQAVSILPEKNQRTLRGVASSKRF